VCMYVGLFFRMRRGLLDFSKVSSIVIAYSQLPSERTFEKFLPAARAERGPDTLTANF